jgi:hypothetical protein
MPKTHKTPKNTSFFHFVKTQIWLKLNCCSVGDSLFVTKGLLWAPRRSSKISTPPRAARIFTEKRASLRFGKNALRSALYCSLPQAGFDSSIKKMSSTRCRFIEFLPFLRSKGNLFNSLQGISAFLRGCVIFLWNLRILPYILAIFVNTYKPLQAPPSPF